MCKHKALMGTVSSDFDGFVKKISKNLSKPDKKFLKDASISLLRAGKPIVCQMARRLPNQHTKFLSRLDRLDYGLTKNSCFDSTVKSQLPDVWLPFFKDDTPIIIDLSDIAKPLARKMDYLATIRDGSTGQLVNGYWLVELYASIGHKNPVPVLLEPFSHNEPESPGQNPIVSQAVGKIFKLTENRGVLIADCGFDGRTMFDEWLDNKYRFVVILVGNRHLEPVYDGFGRPMPVRSDQLAEQVKTPHRFYKTVKRNGKIVFRVCQIGWVKVRLPGRSEDLTMVVSRIPGVDKPMMLLTNLPVENIRDARRVMLCYVRRWECEEAIRFLKSQVNIEMIRTLRWTAIQRLVLLAVLLMIYLGWIIEAEPNLVDRLIRLGQPLPDEPDFLSYRLLAGLTEAINTCFWLHKDLLRRPLWKTP